MTVLACDRMIGGAAVDNAASAAGLTLPAPERAADTPLAADPATGVVAFFGGETQIRHVHELMTGGFLVFIVAADGSKCEALGVGAADLSRGAVDGLAAGARGWIPVRAEQQEMRRANGDQVVIQQTINARGVQMVLLQFRRAAQAPLTGLADQFRLTVAACDAIISGSAIDAAASAAGISPSAPTRVADTDEAKSAEIGIAEFFGADAQIRVASRENAQGVVWFFVAADGGKCQVIAFGQADLFGAAPFGFAAGGWLPIGENSSDMRRPNGDLVRIEFLTSGETKQIARLYFTRGARR